MISKPAVKLSLEHVVTMAVHRDIDFYQLYDDYYAYVKQIIMAQVNNEYVADDLIQETFLRAFRTFDSLKDVEKIKPWLRKIARNICLDHFRQGMRHKRQQAILKKETETQLFLTPMDKEMEKQQMSACVQQQLVHLSKSYRNIIWLYDAMGLTQKEIAETLHISRENVKVRLHRARTKLKTILQEECDFEKDERDILICEPKNRRQGIASWK